VTGARLIASPHRKNHASTSARAAPGDSFGPSSSGRGEAANPVDSPATAAAPAARSPPPEAAPAAVTDEGTGPAEKGQQQLQAAERLAVHLRAAAGRAMDRMPWFWLHAYLFGFHDPGRALLHRGTQLPSSPCRRAEVTFHLVGRPRPIFCISGKRNSPYSRCSESACSTERRLRSRTSDTFSGTGRFHRLGC
jgi:hypothetical protein